ncbi:hypothetical protein B0H19DRAFT_1260371 [Mycena capillaripes]|nr:hypothetical protein B0H19DRAFT_1260371 [Mycena capillaripes]
MAAHRFAPGTSFAGAGLNGNKEQPASQLEQRRDEARDAAMPWGASSSLRVDTSSLSHARATPARPQTAGGEDEYRYTYQGRGTPFPRAPVYNGLRDEGATPRAWGTRRVASYVPPTSEQKQPPKNKDTHLLSAAAAAVYSDSTRSLLSAPRPLSLAPAIPEYVDAEEGPP